MSRLARPVSACPAFLHPIRRLSFALLIMAGLALFAAPACRADIYIQFTWEDEVDIDSDGYKSQSTLRWFLFTDLGEVDIMYEELYYKLSSAPDSEYKFMGDTTEHLVDESGYTVDAPLPEALSHNLYDYLLVAYVYDFIFGDYVPYELEKTNFPELGGHAEEPVAEDVSTPTVSAPIFTPNGGTFNNSINVTITCATPNAQIRYTTDGSTPTASTGTRYSGQFSLTNTTTARAIAYGVGMLDSSVSSATFTSTKVSQTIDFGAVGNRTYGDAPFTLNATASSGLPVTLVVLSGPATLNGNTITLTGAGNVTVRASQAGNSTYDAAPDVDRFFNVARASQTISFSAINDVSVGQAPFNITATASSNLAVAFTVLSGPASVSGNTITLNGTPGSVTVRATQAGDTNYLAAPNSDRTFSVNAKSSQTITFDPIEDKFVSDPPFLVVATSTSGLTVEFTVLSGPALVTGNTVTLTGEEGSVTIRASQPGDLSYLPAPNVNRTFQVKPRVAQTINFNPLPDKTIGDPAFTLSATATSDLPVVFTIRSGPALLSNGNRVTLTGTGAVTIRASQAGNNQYLAASDVDRTFNVLPPPNRAPVFVSLPTVAPGTAYVNDTVTVSVATSDPENDIVTIIVNWGDGTTNTSLTHAYIVSGDYTVTVTLRDTPGAEAAQTTSVTIINPLPLTVSKMTCKFSYTKAGADTVQLTGVLPNLSAGFSFAGKPIAFDVGGATANLTLDGKGAAKTFSASVKFKAKFTKDPVTKAPKFVGGDVPFQMTCKGNFASKWADEGAAANLTIKGMATAMRVTVTFNAARYSTLVDPVYLTSKAGSGGSFVKKK